MTIDTWFSWLLFDRVPSQNTTLIPLDANMGMVDPRTRLIPSRMMPRTVLTQRRTRTSLLFVWNRRMTRTIPLEWLYVVDRNKRPSLSHWPLPHTRIKIHSLNLRGKIEYPLCFTHKELTQGRKLQSNLLEENFHSSKTEKWYNEVAPLYRALTASLGCLINITNPVPYYLHACNTWILKQNIKYTILQLISPYQ